MERRGFFDFRFLLSDLKVIFLCIIILTVAYGCQFGFSADPKAEQKKVETQAPQKVETPPKYNVDDFVYTSENRRDPFEPVYLSKVKRGSVKPTTVEKQVEKKGYELDELKLTGILKSDNVAIVMMEDLQGRGINFKKGDYLNQNLWIVDIREDRVVFGYKLKGEIKNFAIDIPRK
ncbi:MAG: pilus assembly protein PilP [Syntrophorhabdaceae bacterium]|nr:pilus assembly protein PilP [Syntrophorhabdaceae bacterium]